MEKNAVRSLKMQSTQRRKNAESVYCGDAGVSPAEGLRFVVLVSNVNPTVYCGGAGISPAEDLQCAVMDAARQLHTANYFGESKNPG